MVKLFLYANYYYNMGFNITHVIPKLNEQRGISKNPFKSSTNDSSNLDIIRQKYSDILDFNWEDSVGIGTNLGFNNLRALDFDGCNNIEFIKDVLEKIGLPRNYEWVVQSGSKNGFHIIFYSENHNYTQDKSKTKAFVPSRYNKENFSVLELRWSKHLILPPSLSKDFHKYKFLNCELPVSRPEYVRLDLIEELVKWQCLDNDGSSNVHTYGIQHYYEHEFLDFSPLILKSVAEICNHQHHDFEQISFKYFKNAIINFVVGSFAKGYLDLRKGFEKCSCDCDLVELFNENYSEINNSLENSDLNCKGYEFDFIRAVFYFFINSEKFGNEKNAIYLNALHLIESYIKQFPEDELGYYIKGRILSGLEQYYEAIDVLMLSLEKQETSRVFYRIGRIKEDKLKQSGIGYLFKSIQMYPSSLCCNIWLKDISEKNKIKLTSDRYFLSNYFSNKSKSEYISILKYLRNNGKINLKTGRTIVTFEAFEEFTKQLSIDQTLFFKNDNKFEKLNFEKDKKLIDKLTKSIFTSIEDYRSDENDKSVEIDETGIKAWINQFDDSLKVVILEELDKIFKIRYCSKKKMNGFLGKLITDLAESNGYKNNIKLFLKEVSFLNLQPEAKSQGVILDLLNNILIQKYNISLKDCGTTKVRFYIYLDDILCTGLTLVSDIIEWSKLSDFDGIKNQENVENGQAKLIFSYAFVHKKNYQKKISEMRLKISNKFAENCKLISLIEVDNSLSEESKVDLIFPIDNEKNSLDMIGKIIVNKIFVYKNKVIDIVDKHTKRYNSVSSNEFYRPESLPRFESLFTNEKNRHLLEQAFLEKGIDILNNVKSANINMRPLGYSIPSIKNFGFGALCFTWRNVPNNAPLVFWYSFGGFTPLFKVTRGVKTNVYKILPPIQLEITINDEDLPF